MDPNETNGMEAKMAKKVVEYIGPIDEDVIVRIVGQTDLEVQEQAEAIVRAEWDPSLEELADFMESANTTDWTVGLQMTIDEYLFGACTVVRREVGDNVNIEPMNNVPDLR